MEAARESSFRFSMQVAIAFITRRSSLHSRYFKYCLARRKEGRKGQTIKFGSFEFISSLLFRKIREHFSAMIDLIEGKKDFLENHALLERRDLQLDTLRNLSRKSFDDKSTKNESFRTELIMMVSSAFLDTANLPFPCAILPVSPMKF